MCIFILFTKNFDNEFQVIFSKIHFLMFSNGNLFVYKFMNCNNLCSTIHIRVTCVVTVLCVSSRHSCASVRLECRTVIQHRHSSVTRKTTPSRLHLMFATYQLPLWVILACLGYNIEMEDKFTVHKMENSFK